MKCIISNSFVITIIICNSLSAFRLICCELYTIYQDFYFICDSWNWLAERCNRPISQISQCMVLLPDTLNCGLRMRRECRERFPRSPQVSDPDMHHGTCVTHVPWCMPELLTSGFLWSSWRGKRSRHSRRMRNPQFHVSGKRPIGQITHNAQFCNRNVHTCVHFCYKMVHWGIWSYALWDFCSKSIKLHCMA